MKGCRNWMDVGSWCYDEEEANVSFFFNERKGIGSHDKKNDFGMS